MRGIHFFPILFLLLLFFEVILHLAGIIRRFADDPGGMLLEKQDAEAIAGRAILDLLQGEFAGTLEAGAVSANLVHAERGVKHDQVVGADAILGPGEHGLGPEEPPKALGPRYDGQHRQDGQAHDRGPDQKQQKLLEPHASRILPLGTEEETHGGPGDDLEAAPIEQVDDHRHRHRDRSRHEPEHGQERHGYILYPSRRAEHREVPDSA